MPSIGLYYGLLMMNPSSKLSFIFLFKWMGQNYQIENVIHVNVLNFIMFVPYWRVKKNTALQVVFLASRFTFA